VPSKVSYRVLSGTVVGGIQCDVPADRGAGMMNSPSRFDGEWQQFDFTDTVS